MNNSLLAFFGTSSCWQLLDPAIVFLSFYTALFSFCQRADNFFLSHFGFCFIVSELYDCVDKHANVLRSTDVRLRFASTSCNKYCSDMRIQTNEGM